MPIKSIADAYQPTGFSRRVYSNWLNSPVLKPCMHNEKDQRTNGPVNAHLIHLSWPSEAQNIQNLENIW